MLCNRVVKSIRSAAVPTQMGIDLMYDGRARLRSPGSVGASRQRSGRRVCMCVCTIDAAVSARASGRASGRAGGERAADCVDTSD